MIKKHLIFHFFIPDDYETNIAIKMHFACLWKYSEVFDSAEFFISSSSESAKYINSVKLTLLNVFTCKDIRFKEVENDYFYEARTLKENLIDKLDDFEETMVFFGHTKGVRDVTMFPTTQENFLKWIYGLYFYSLEYAEEAENKLFTFFHGRSYTFFGSFTTIRPTDGHCYLAGTFYWTNPMTLKKDIDSGEAKLGKMNDRAYAEDLPGIYERKVVDGFVLCKTGGHICRESKWAEFDFYEGDFDEIIQRYGNYEEFMEGYNEVKKEIV